MRDKTLAGILALLLGGAGIHRFYLGQIGLGFLYLFFFWISWIVGIIDAIALFSMDQDDFDRKYNKFLFERREEYQPRAQQRRRYSSDRRQERPASANRERRQRPSYQRSQPAGEAPRSNRDYRRPQPKPANPFRSEGIRLFKEYDYRGAIESFHQALETDPRDVATHWNLACAYSLEEEKDKAFYHLDKAVTFGFDDKDRIRNHDALAYLRIQPDYQQFVENGFRLIPQLDAPKEDLLTQFEAQEQAAEPQPAAQIPPISADLLDQLQRLGELREKGLLTEEEFAAQKRKLLG
jgi:TM2 domain-containing membrane protein YozV